jgi:hypothetical protein
MINRRQKGDHGEASAIEWLTNNGALVWVWLGHSPDVDLIGEVGNAMIRIQVKTTTRMIYTPEGDERWSTALSTNGGNQSWSGLTKRFDSSKVDYLFVFVGDGRRWFIPAGAVESRSALALAGVRYSEFEVEPGMPIMDLVYAGTKPGSRIDPARKGERRSRRAGPVCKIGGLSLSGFDSHLPHSPSPEPAVNAPVERKLGRAGQAIVRNKRQMTIPARPFIEAELAVGDRLRFRADGAGRGVMERIGRPTTVFDPA